MEEIRKPPRAEGAGCTRGGIASSWDEERRKRGDAGDVLLLPPPGAGYCSTLVRVLQKLFSSSEPHERLSYPPHKTEEWLCKDKNERGEDENGS
jgi:hypothetical protein